MSDLIVGKRYCVGNSPIDERGGWHLIYVGKYYVNGEYRNLFQGDDDSSKLSAWAYVEEILEKYND